METPDTGEAGCGYARATDALTRRRLACLALLGVPVAGVGFCASFAGVSAMFEPWRWAWAVPVTVDVTILTCTLALLFGAEVGHRWAPVRPVLYGLITTTVYLNWATATTLAERVGHAAAPAVYAFLVEMLVSWERFRRRLTGPARDGVPFGVWLTAPRFAWAVQRTIWRTGAPGYAHAEAVLRARRELAGRWRQRHGRRWRTAIDPADRVRATSTTRCTRTRCVWTRLPPNASAYLCVRTRPRRTRRPRPRLSRTQSRRSSATGTSQVQLQTHVRTRPDQCSANPWKRRQRRSSPGSDASRRCARCSASSGWAGRKPPQCSPALLSSRTYQASQARRC
jgi:hypothetical protein